MKITELQGTWRSAIIGATFSIWRLLQMPQLAGLGVDVVFRIRNSRRFNGSNWSLIGAVKIAAKMLVFSAVVLCASGSELEKLLAQAQSGDSNAQLKLGMAFRGMKGKGIPKAPKDDQQAASWFCEAAFRANSEAQFHLAAQLTTGSGILMNRVHAYAWLALAARENAAFSRYANAARGGLTRAEVDNGQQLSEELRKQLTSGPVGGTCKDYISHIGEGVAPVPQKFLPRKGA